MRWLMWLGMWLGCGCLWAAPAPVIVLPEGAPTAERHAAEELQYFCGRITGEAPAIVPEAPADAPAYVLGRGPAVRALLPELDLDALRPDQVILRRVGDRLVLTGAEPSGTLYAVYTLLEDFYGVKFLATDAVIIPENATLELPEVDYSYAPPFASRTAMYYSLMYDDPLLAVRLRNNGEFIREAMADWGVTEKYAGGIHTFDRLIPVARYFAAHPEYFSLRDGERVGGQLTGQLCLTNPELVAELTRNVLALLRATPDATIVSVSQNDNNLPCQCGNCRAADETYGSPSGTLLACVNQVADAVAAEFPKVTVETFAYIYTAEAPRGIVPRPNVTVRLCSFNSNFSRPLDSDGNRAFQRQLQAWSRIAPRLIVWNYVTNFSNTMLPWPNFDHLAADLRTFAAHPVTGVLEQGAWNNGMSSEFLPLKSWLVSKLLWDPTQDPRELRESFLADYYGAAAPELEEYIALLEREVAGQELFMGCFASPRSWLRSETALQAYEIMCRAEAVAAAESSPEQLERVKLAALASKLALLERADILISLFGERVPPLEPLLAEALAVARRHDSRNYSEGAPFEAFAAELTRKVAAAGSAEPSRAATAPAVAAQLQGAEYYDLQEFLLGSGNSLCDDPAASDGRAIRVPGTCYDWSIQFHRNLDVLALEPGRYRLVVVARAEGSGEGGMAFEAGHYNLDTKVTQSATRSLRDVKGTAYREIDMGVHEMNPQCYFFVAPVKNADMTWLYVDRLIVIPQ